MTAIKDSSPRLIGLQRVTDALARPWRFFRHGVDYIRLIVANRRLHSSSQTQGKMSVIRIFQEVLSRRAAPFSSHSLALSDQPTGPHRCDPMFLTPSSRAVNAHDAPWSLSRNPHTQYRMQLNRVRSQPILIMGKVEESNPPQHNRYRLG